MKKLLAILSFVLLPLAAHADKINGQFIYKNIFSDGSKETIVAFVEGNTLKTKRLGDDDFWMFPKLIHIGKSSEFKTFVYLNNALVEDIVTIVFDPEPGNGEYHFSAITTGVAWKSKSRLTHGTCDKI
jgi:hypothetical protein